MELPEEKFVKFTNRAKKFLLYIEMIIWMEIIEKNVISFYVVFIIIVHIKNTSKIWNITD